MFTARYFAKQTNASDQMELFSYSELVRYVFLPDELFFVIDEAASNLDKKQIIGFYNDDTANFIQHNLENLKEMVVNGSQNQKKWLENTLAQVEDTPAKTELQALLSVNAQ